MDTLTDLVRRLERIAKANDEEFRYYIEIDVGRAERFTFMCEETADGHRFIGSQGRTIDEAVANAASDVEDSCAEWDYECVP